MSDPNTMMPAHAATQKVTRDAIFRSYRGLAARFCRRMNSATPMPATTNRPIAEIAQVGHRDEVEPDDQGTDHHGRQEPADVVDGLRGLVDVGRHVLPRHVQGEDREGQRDEEHRSPGEVQEQEAGDHGTEHRDAAAEGGPHRDRAGPGWSRPQRGDERQGRRIGHAGRQTAHDARTQQDGVAGREGGHDGRWDGQADAKDHQELAPVPIAKGAEPEDGGGQAE